MCFADLIEPYTTLVVDVELIKIKGRVRKKSEDKKSKNQDLKNNYKPEYLGLKAGRENKQGQSMIIHHFSGVTFLKQLLVK